MEGGQGNSYGGRFSGGDFDLIEFLKHPQTICRLLCILFGVVVFGCISAAGNYGPHNECIFNRNQDACQYGTVIGVLAFLQCLLYLVIDAQFDSLSNSEMRRYVVLVDLVFCGAWTFLWFVGFCFLADEWRRASIFPTNESNHARAAITFSFFSIFSWIPLTFFAYQRYKQGSGFNAHPSSDYQTGGVASPTGVPPEYKQYASFPLPADSEPTSYQQPVYQPAPPPPFGAAPQPPQLYNTGPIKTDYEVPNY